MPGLGQRDHLTSGPLLASDGVRPAEEIARLVRENYSDQALDDLADGVEDQTLVTDSTGFASVVVDRAQQDEPFRSFHLIDSRAVGDIVVTTFAWGDVSPGEMTYLMPLETGRLGLKGAGEMEMQNVLTRYIEWTLGGPRESWEADRATAVGPRLSVVRPWLQDG